VFYWYSISPLLSYSSFHFIDFFTGFTAFFQVRNQTLSIDKPYLSL
jgi:hypothetical protein